MRKEEFDKIKDENSSPAAIGTYELWDKTPRTLLKGTTKWLHNWHVYMDERRQMWLNIYTNGNYVIFNKCFGSRVLIEDLLYNTPHSARQLNPEQCDYAFCSLLISKGTRLPFKNYADAETDDKVAFYGKRAQECVQINIK